LIQYKTYESLITYDVSRRQSEVKKALKNLSYYDYWTDNNNNYYYLPNTTLWKTNITLYDALTEVKTVVAKLNQGQPVSNQIELERCACVNANPWAAIPGKAHKE
jgi:hypothetical protein